MSKVKLQEAIRLARQLLEALGQSPDAPANEEKPLDREAIAERARRAAERMQRARKR